MPARTNSLWLTTSASAGSSLSVGIKLLLQRIWVGQGVARKLRAGGSRGFGVFLFGKLLNFFDQRVDNLSFGHLADHLALFEDKPDPLAAGHAQVGGSGFAR